MVPVNEVSLVISDPQKAKSAPQLKEQPANGPPSKGSRFNPIYVEPGSTSIQSTRDLQALFPNSFNCISDMSGECDIKTDPTVLPVQHGRRKVQLSTKMKSRRSLVRWFDRESLQNRLNQHHGSAHWCIPRRQATSWEFVSTQKT